MGRPQPRLRLCAMLSLALVASVATFLLSGCSLTSEHVSRWLPRPAQQARPSPAPEPTDRSALELMPANPARSGGTVKADTVKPSTQNPQDATQVSPNGRWQATASVRASTHVLSIRQASREDRGGSQIRSTQPPIGLTWAPDSSKLAFLRRDVRNRTTWQVWLVDPASGRAEQVSSAVDRAAPTLAWFPDSRRLALGTEGWLTMADTQTGRVRAVALPEGRPVAGALAVSPDGQSVVLALTRGGVWVASTADGTLIRVADEGDVDGLAWAPGGREVAVRTASDGRWRVRVVRK